MPSLFTKELQLLPLVQPIGDLYNVPAALIFAHMKQESNFNPNAYKAEPALNDGSTGLMQVLLQTAKSIDKNATNTALLDPSYNIAIGTQYIAKNLQRYPNNVKDAIAAYNAGSAYKDQNGNYVSKSGNTAVQGYVDKVYANYQKYTDWLSKSTETQPPPVITFGWIDILIPLAIAGVAIAWIIWRDKQSETSDNPYDEED